MKNQLLAFVICVFGFSSCVKKANRYVGKDNDLNFATEAQINDGYSVQNARNYTGSAQEVKDVPNNLTLDNYLRRVAGVSVSGQGSSASILIHGVSSFNSSNEPLFILNGMALSSYSSAYTQINPNEIGSVTVLKDASSTAIYGSRATNGVVVISLKKM